MITYMSKGSNKRIISESSLKEIVNISDLSTFEAVYNGVAEVANEKKPENIDYYVSYEAKVKAGFDFTKIDIKVDHKDKIIQVILPKIQITDVNVDITTLDYIFVNNNANTSTVSEQAYKKCIEDVTAESKKEQAIYELAQQNAHNIIEALIMPFVEQQEEDYKLEIIQGDK